MRSIERLVWCEDGWPVDSVQLGQPRQLWMFDLLRWHGFTNRTFYVQDLENQVRQDLEDANEK